MKRQGYFLFAASETVARIHQEEGNEVQQIAEGRYSIRYPLQYDPENPLQSALDHIDLIAEDVETWELQDARRNAICTEEDADEFFENAA